MHVCYVRMLSVYTLHYRRFRLLECFGTLIQRHLVVEAVEELERMYQYSIQSYSQDIAVASKLFHEYRYTMPNT
jgi:hypothetical protein